MKLKKEKLLSRGKIQLTYLEIQINFWNANQCITSQNTQSHIIFSNWLALSPKVLIDWIVYVPTGFICPWGNWDSPTPSVELAKLQLWTKSLTEDHSS